MLQRTAVRAASCRRAMPPARPSAAANACAPRFVAPSVRRTFLRARDSRRAAHDTLDVEKLTRTRRDYERTRLVFLATGSVAGLIAMGYTGWQLKKLLEKNPTKLDAAGSDSAANDALSSSSSAAGRKVVVHGKDGHDLVPTGNSTVPAFPRTVELPRLVAEGDLPAAAAAAPAANDRVQTTPLQANGDPYATIDPAAHTATADEYTLVGLGTRTVSFLGIQVYVVGFYVATADIAVLQARLIKRVNPIATALVSGEKDDLRTALLDPVQGEALWSGLLRDGVPARSLFRIVPVRDTDFHHLRDGFVRAIQARAPAILQDGPDDSPASADKAAAASNDFGEAVRQFRQVFNRGRVPKQKELLLVRDADGGLRIVYDDGRSAGRQLLGAVRDERLSRALWLNYLGGRTVASEPARQSIVDGVIEFVERPVGTVATQVV
ncbi:Chalcone isomerase, subgroup [Niveomyces insectorum RCEF 264]|uniref:Chalcone isomerase, subgroup n=1 Tax=Niveomyces insectorum RCEF 264 TaxID=1081102 RepID=A0A167PDH4_9HYPO|nr:Chalcone isomerase, subgroup [Niveomyces insectorum RCEF 264]